MLAYLFLADDVIEDRTKDWKKNYGEDPENLFLTVLISAKDVHNDDHVDDDNDDV